ncbi:ras-related protein Rab-5B-like [Saccoglossus kowalevskii]
MSRNGSTQRYDKRPQRFQYKLVLVGEAGVGKSSLAMQYVRGEFDKDMQTTIGAAFTSKTLHVENALIELQIWDTAGTEKYHSLASMYYRGAHAAIVVYDITQQTTFLRVNSWVRELHRQATPNIAIILAGNKADLEDTRKVSCEDAQAYANDNSITFIETSAKTALNVDDLFSTLAIKLHEENMKLLENEKGDPDTLKIGSKLPADQSTHKRRCCKT